jgi:hypothetical protein
MSYQKVLQKIIWVTLVMILLVGCSVPSGTPVLEAPAATSTSVFTAVTPTQVPPTPTPTPTETLTSSITLTPSNIPTPTFSPPPTQRPTLTQTLTSTPTVTPSTGNIHGVTRYECNNQPVFSYDYAVIFKPGAQWALDKVEVDENGEFWFKNLEPGQYDLYRSSTPGVVFTYGTEESVKVEAGKTAEVTLYTIRCPLLRLVSPVDGEVITTTRPEFKWENFRPGSWYVVTIEGKIGETQQATLEKTQETSIWFLRGLEFGETYNWYICITNASEGISMCSLRETFTVTGDIGPEEGVVPALIQALDDESERVRWDAATALLEIGPEAVPALIEALENGNESVRVRETIVMLLGDIGPEEGVVPALIQAITDESEKVSMAAPQSLGHIGPEEGVIPALILALKDGRSAVRFGAALGLETIGPEAVEAIPALVEALEDESGLVREGAASALTAITGQDFGQGAKRWQQWWEEQE